MGPGLFGGCSWASAQYEAPVHSLLCRWADCNEYPFRGQERLTLASAGDRACANRAFGLGSTRHSTRNCGPSGPGFGLPVQAGFGRSARRLSETVLEADSSSGPSEAVHSGTTPPSRWIGSSSRPPQRQQLACELHAEERSPGTAPRGKPEPSLRRRPSCGHGCPSGHPGRVDAESASRPIARTSALPVVAFGSPQPREQWSSTAGS